MRALVREGSLHKLAKGCTPVVGDASDQSTFVDRIAPADTFVQLIGTPHPSPRKAKEFEQVDLTSVRASVTAAQRASVRHFVYVSVAQPAPMMRAYISVRAQGERLIRESGMSATILRPWYVLGPGHRWPYLLMTLYWLMEAIPATREGAKRLGLVTIEQMIEALTQSVDDPAEGVRVLSVTDIRHGHPSR